jgi:hypothetical protein
MFNRNQIINHAEKDFNSEIVSIKDIAIDNLILPKLNVAIDDFTYAAPDWDIYSISKLWLVFCSQAFQFKHLENDGAKSKTHYMGMTGSNAVLCMIRDCFPLEDKINREKLDFILKTLPLYEQRSCILNEIFKNTLKLDGLVSEIIESARNGMITCDLANKLANEFPLSFEDPYLKKAQLAISTIAGCVQHKEGVSVKDDLTAFADYEVPRVLRSLGVIEYSGDLLCKLRNGTPILKDSAEELAIRAATILAVEKMSNNSAYSASQIDNYLWQYQRNIGETEVHVTDTTFY